jgi:hypothetical protein
MQFAWITGGAPGAREHEGEHIAIRELRRAGTSGCTHPCVTLSADGQWADDACDTRHACVCQASGTASPQYTAAAPQLRQAEPLPAHCEPGRQAAALDETRRRQLSTLADNHTIDHNGDYSWYMGGMHFKVLPLSLH